jgi:hypothetical protein
VSEEICCGRALADAALLPSSPITTSEAPLGFRGRITDEVPTVLRTTLKHPKHEPLLEGAAERIHAAVRELKELRIVDEKGIRVRTDIPEDTKEGSDRDFGG